MCRSIFGMDKDVPGLMTPFDELVTTPELQIIKLLIPFPMPLHQGGRRWQAWSNSWN